METFYKFWSGVSAALGHTREDIIAHLEAGDRFYTTTAEFDYCELSATFTQTYFIEYPLFVTDVSYDAPEDSSLSSNGGSYGYTTWRPVRREELEAAAARGNTSAIEVLTRWGNHAEVE